MQNPFGRNLAIDIGTANTVIYQSNGGIVLNEPSIVCINTDTGEILSVGHEARKMVGRTPAHIVSIKPLKDGVVADFETAQKMLRMFMAKVGVKRLFTKPIVVVAVPPVVTSVEHRAIKDAAYAAGAKKVYIMEEPMAAAIGAGLPIQEPIGSMIVDIGGGTTDVAVISLGGIVTSRSVRVGGDAFDAAIVNYIKSAYNLMIGERTAEEVKMAIGSAAKLSGESAARIRGRDLVSGLPKDLMVSPEEIRGAIEDQLLKVISAIKATLDETPPDLVADLSRTGIVLAGGGALLKGLCERLTKETGMPVRVAEDPLYSVVNGAGKCVENIGLLQQILAPEKR
ncbi:rod shape-determining protein Mbl [freshwater metagenome]|uniref:Rod shape-determining protein Mbl n=1 Tax=freshwater metagenome TaxID=449393 RepID=A0A094PNL1_9ZZZZ